VRGVRSTTVLGLLAVVTFGVAVPTLISLLGAPLRVPRNDAWSYSRIAEVFHDTGHYELLRYGRMTLVGHIGWAQPFLSVFDNREVAGNVAGIVASAIAFSCFYLLARRFVPALPALAAVGLLAIFPGVWSTVPTFMTEPTALALTGLSLLLAVAALRAEGSRAGVLLGASVLVAVVGFAVREFGIAVLLAVVAAALVRREDLRRVAWASGLSGVAACGGIYLWHAQLPYLEPTPLRFDLSNSVSQPARGICTLALGLLPFTLAAAIPLLRRVRRERHLTIGLGVGAAVALVALTSSLLALDDSRSVLASYMYTRSGVSSQSLAVGTRPALVPDLVWAPINLAAAFGAVCLALVVAELVSQRVRGVLAGGDWVLLEFFAGCHVAVVLTFALLGPLFDERYWWPAVVPIALLVWRVYRPGTLAKLGLAAAWGAAGVLMLFAALFAHDSGEYDGARWLAAERLVAQGAVPQDIDGGLEWVGAHASGPRSLDSGPVDQLHPYYEYFFPRRRCWTISNEPLDPATHELVDTATYRSRFWLAKRTIYVERLRSCATG
jgi:Dolichyl-phosphate-mannose-protein mannosyltransferase